MQGRNLYRLKDNPCEKSFVKAFSDMVDKDPNILVHICGEEYLDNVRETDCMSVIQWLGSHVGQYFVIGVLEKQGLVTKKS